MFVITYFANGNRFTIENYINFGHTFFLSVQIIRAFTVGFYSNIPQCEFTAPRINIPDLESFVIRTTHNLLIINLSTNRQNVKISFSH